jgi:methyl coenzyme M reductase subunit C
VSKNAYNVPIINLWIQLFIKHMKHYEMTVYHGCDIYIHMIYRVTIIVQQYGLPKILFLLSRVDVVPRELYYNVDAPAIV